MKPLISSMLVSCIALGTGAQQLHQVSFNRGSEFTYFTFMKDPGVLVRVSADGKILEWGSEVQSDRNSNYYAPRLQPYLGRVEYYGPETDSVFRGKVKSIGTCNITYYGSYESDSKPGKLRSLGSLMMDYYSLYENAAFRGKIKLAGSLPIEYYTSSDDEAYRGKLKSVGNTPIKYYSVFDDQQIRGKIKSIGTFNYTWYTSFDRREMRGNLKSGLYRQYISGVTYVLR